MNSYQEMIREQLARTGRIGIDPRHVEAYMRLEHSTLDALSKQQFAREVDISAQCVKATALGGEYVAEELARSYGL